MSVRPSVRRSHTSWNPAKVPFSTKITGSTSENASYAVYTALFCKNGLFSHVFQIWLNIKKNICLKLLFHLDSTTSQALIMSFEKFKKSHRNLKKDELHKKLPFCIETVKIKKRKKSVFSKMINLETDFLFYAKYAKI